MAGNNIRVNTDQVSQIASNLERLNKRLTEELTNSKATVDSLASVWEGEAAQATIQAFDDFAAKYFQTTNWGLRMLSAAPDPLLPHTMKMIFERVYI